MSVEMVEDSRTGEDFHAIVSELNLRAKTHPIGKLQEIRKDLKGLKRAPAPIFILFEDYAFHIGGRKELQFNVGIERVNGMDELRHGVAFSLKTSRSLPSTNVLLPKVRLFNNYIQLYPDKYADMRMWQYDYKRKTEIPGDPYMPTSIPPDRADGFFTFLGKRQPLGRIDYESLLDDLDRLLPLYKYVESGGNLQPISTVMPTPFRFRPGCTVKASATVMFPAQKALDVNLRHNILEEALYRRLAEKYGAENVGTELENGAGTSVDVVVRQKEIFWFFEIKTEQSPRACLRQALGQLLEYAFWPGTQEASRLIVVGETALDKEGKEYIRTLRERFSLPLEYEQISV